MNRITRLILVSYCVALICCALFVPWSYHRDGISYQTEYAYIFSDMGRKSIDYGRIGLELISFTGIAGIAYLLQEQFDRIAKKMKSPVTAATEKTKESYKDMKTYLAELKLYWFGEEVLCPNKHVAITRFRIILWIVILTWIYMVRTDKDLGDIVKMIFGHEKK